MRQTSIRHRTVLQRQGTVSAKHRPHTSLLFRTCDASWCSYDDFRPSPAVVVRLGACLWSSRSENKSCPILRCEYNVYECWCNNIIVITTTPSISNTKEQTKVLTSTRSAGVFHSPSVTRHFIAWRAWGWFVITLIIWQYSPVAITKFLFAVYTPCFSAIVTKNGALKIYKERYAKCALWPQYV